MPITLNSLTAQQKRTSVYAAGLILALSIAGWLVYGLNAKRTDVAKAKQEIERKEHDIQNVVTASPEDQARWQQQERQLGNLLLTDDAVPQFFEEVTRIANENHLQRLGLNTEETVIDPNNSPSPEQMRLLGVGIRRYLVVTVKFQGEYPDVARFLGGVSTLPRPVEYHTIELRRSPPLIDVTVVMNVYKREAA